MHEMLNDAYRNIPFNDDHVDKSSINDDTSKFYGYIKYANQVMRLGCKFNQLRIIVQLFNMKCLQKVMDNAFDMLLDLSNQYLIGRRSFMNHFMLLKKNQDLKFSYKKIIEYLNNYMLYWRETSNLVECSTQKTSR